MTRRVVAQAGAIPRARSASGWSTRRELAAALHRAIESKEISVVYQPVHALSEKAWSGVEALARWTDPHFGPVPPDAFIPVAERCGLIGALTRLISAQVCRDWDRWRCSSFGRSMQVAINLSAADLAVPTTLDAVVGDLQAHGLPLDQFTVEITETAPLRVGAASRRALEEVRDAGSQIALDDFGAGHSRMEDLRRVPVTTLKLDRSFTHAPDAGLADPEMAASVKAIADTFGLSTIAEGVETTDEAQALASLGYDQAQGWLFGHPMTRPTITRALNEHGGVHTRRSPA